MCTGLQPRELTAYTSRRAFSGSQRGGLFYFICLLCSFPELLSFLCFEGEDFTSVKNTWVVSDTYNCFSVWSPHICFLALLLLHSHSAACAEATSLATHRLCAVVRAVLHALEVDFLHCLQFLLISETCTRSTRALTYLITL